MNHEKILQMASEIEKALDVSHALESEAAMEIAKVLFRASYSNYLAAQTNPVYTKPEAE